MSPPVVIVDGRCWACRGTSLHLTLGIEAATSACACENHIAWCGPRRGHRIGVLENSNRLPTTGGVQLHSAVLTHAHLDHTGRLPLLTRFDREHPSLSETAVLAREAIKQTMEQGGRVLVPTFAIGRLQIGDW